MPDRSSTCLMEDPSVADMPDRILTCLLETGMPDRRQTCLIEDRYVWSKTNMSDWMLTNLIKTHKKHISDLRPTRSSKLLYFTPIIHIRYSVPVTTVKDILIGGNPNFDGFGQIYISYGSLIKHVGLRSGTLVSNQACQSLIRHIGCRSGKSVSDQTCQSTMGLR